MNFIGVYSGISANETLINLDNVTDIHETDGQCTLYFDLNDSDGNQVFLTVDHTLAEIKQKIKEPQNEL